MALTDPSSQMSPTTDARCFRELIRSTFLDQGDDSECTSPAQEGPSILRSIMDNMGDSDRDDTTDRASNPDRNPSQSENRRATKSTSCSRLKTYPSPTAAQLEKHHQQLKQQALPSLIQDMASAENANPNTRILQGTDPEPGPIANENRNAKSGSCSLPPPSPPAAAAAPHKQPNLLDQDPIRHGTDTVHTPIPEPELDTMGFFNLPMQFMTLMSSHTEHSLQALAALDSSDPPPTDSSASAVLASSRVCSLGKRACVEPSEDGNDNDNDNDDDSEIEDSNDNSATAAIKPPILGLKSVFQEQPTKASLLEIKTPHPNPAVECPSQSDCKPQSQSWSNPNYSHVTHVHFTYLPSGIPIFGEPIAQVRVLHPDCKPEAATTRGDVGEAHGPARAPGDESGKESVSARREAADPPPEEPGLDLTHDPKLDKVSAWLDVALQLEQVSSSSSNRGIPSSSMLSSSKEKAQRVLQAATRDPYVRQSVLQTFSLLRKSTHHILQEFLDQAMARMANRKKKV